MTPVFPLLKSFSGILFLSVFIFLFHSRGVSQIVNPPSDCPFTFTVFTEGISCQGEQDGKIFLNPVPFSDTTQLIAADFTYIWSDPQAEGQNPTGLNSGIYSVTVNYIPENNTRCSLIIENILVPAPTPLVIGCFPTEQVSLVGGSDGQGKILFGGGSEPYNIEWAGPVAGSTTAEFSGFIFIDGLRAGQYTVTVTDACSLQDTCIFSIEGPSCDDLVSVESEDPTCSGNANGFIFFTSNYDDREFEYTWVHDNFVTTEPFRGGLQAGNYTINVADNKGCSLSVFRALTVQNPLSTTVGTIVPDNAIVYGGQGEIGLQVLSSSTYSITWFGASSGSQSNLNAPNFTIPNLSEGSYNIIAVDDQGCQAQEKVTVPSSFVVPPNQDFIMDFSNVENNQSVTSFVNDLLAQGAILINSCHCNTEVALIQYWRSDADPGGIILDGVPQGAQATMKQDGSGFFESITTPPGEAIPLPGSFINCVYVPGQSPAKNYKVRVAIIDSGVNLTHSDNSKPGHPALTGIGWTNPNTGDNNQCEAGDAHGYDYINKTPFVIDSIGHGTHIAGIIANAFPENIGLEIINLKVYSPVKPGNVFDLTCAIHYAISHGADIINLSLGYEQKFPFKPLYNALKRAQDNGILVVLSAGNELKNIDALLADPAAPKRWPASFKAPGGVRTHDGEPLSPLNNLLVIASENEYAINRLDSTYSNFGKTLVDVVTVGAATAPHLNDLYATLKGTSMATGFVTRALAIVKAYVPFERATSLIARVERSITVLDPVSQGKIRWGKLSFPLLFAPFLSDPRFPVTKTSVNDSTIPTYNFTKGNVVRDNIVIKLGDGNTFYENVEIYVARLFKGAGWNQIEGLQFHTKYCSVKEIIWDGKNNAGVRLSHRGNNSYFVMVAIDGVWIMNDPQSIVIARPQ
ncbi:MAG: S8 family serine peptidase [Saprospiraceae bacterium]